MNDATRPKLLLLSFVAPSPTGSGARMRAWAWLETLRRHYQVHLLLLGEAASPDLAQRVCSLTTIDRRWASIEKAPDPGRGSLRYLFAVLSQPPAGLWRLTADERRQVAEALPLRQFDAVFAIRLSMAVVASDLLDAGLIQAIPIGFDLDDRESLLAQRRARLIGKSHGHLMAFEAHWRARRLHHVEQRMFRRWQRVFVCSSDDATQLTECCDDAVFKAVPNTVVDPGMLSQPASATADGKLLFVGSLAYAPNEDGLEWFMREVWPLLRRDADGMRIRLAVVGRSPTARVRTMVETADVTLSADVPEVKPYYAAADVIVVPLRIGGGTRIKIIEALALGRAVVSTSLGAEGLHVRDGHDIVIADHAADFANACLQLLRTPEHRQQLCRYGRATFERHYTISAFISEAGQALGLPE